MVPFYISESVQWSGIVSLVAMGFFMDVYISPPKQIASTCNAHSVIVSENYNAMQEDEDVSVATSVSVVPVYGTRRIRLSRVAEKHIRFFAHVTAKLSESAIFAYLGLFLFSQKYSWDPSLISIGIASCIVSRALMVVLMCQFVLFIYRMRGNKTKLEGEPNTENDSDNSSALRKTYMSRTAVAIRDQRTQAVLVLAGLRGAVSLALIENVPLYNALTGEGCKYKPVMKGMTSAAIIFTTFVLGGVSYFLLPILGFGPDLKDSPGTGDDNRREQIELSRSTRTTSAAEVDLSRESCMSCLGSQTFDG